MPFESEKGFLFGKATLIQNDLWWLYQNEIKHKKLFMSKETMKVNTNISKMDLVCFNLAISPKSRSTYVSILVIAMFVFGLFCWKNGFPQTQNNWAAILVSSIGGGFFGVLFGLVFSMILILLMSSAKNEILGEHEYTLTPEGLYEKTLANEGLSKWSGITKVNVAGSYLLFQISGYLFHIVPARSFNSKEDFNEFVSASMKYWQKEHNKSFQGTAGGSRYF